MKKLVIFMLWLGVVGSAFGQYTLIVDGVTNSIEVGQTRPIQLADGRNVDVLLQQESRLTCAGTFFSFQHDRAHHVNAGEAGEGIHQTLLTTPRGALILIQEYSETAPDNLVEMMLEQITKNEAAGDFELNKSKTSRKVGELELKGLTSISLNKHTSWTREVFSYSSGERGVLIITALETKNNSREQEMIDLFWDSLMISMPAETPEVK